MSTTLVRYEQARYALAECQRVDEVKDIRDKAAAMAAYAKQAKDTDMIEWATEIKVRAERRCGEMLAQIPREIGGRPADNSIKSKTSYQSALESTGLSQTSAYQYERLASMPEEHFETAIATAKDTAGAVSTSFMLREAAKAKPQGKPMKGAKAEALRAELKAAKERGVSMLETYARLTLSAVRAQDSFTEQEHSLLAELMDVIAAVTAESAKP